MTDKALHNEFELLCPRDFSGSYLKLVGALQLNIVTVLCATQDGQRSVVAIDAAVARCGALNIDLTVLEQILREIQSTLVASNKRLQDRSYAHLGIGSATD